MDIGSILLIFALLILVGLYISRPLFEHKPVPLKQEDQELSTLLAERECTIKLLQELDFDYGLGKIPEEDYPTQRISLLQRGAEILRKLDSFQTAPYPQAAEEHLEASLTTRQAVRGQPQAETATDTIPDESRSLPDDVLEAMIATRRRSRAEKAGGFCHKCGGVVQKSDRFCPKCGILLRS